MYTIDINDPTQRTKGNVRRMIASGDERQHSQIRLRKDGRLYVAHVLFSEDRLQGVLFRSQIYTAGENRVGLAAAEDTEYIREVCEGLKKLHEAYETLKTEWPRPRDHLIYRAKDPYPLEPPMVEGYVGPYAHWTKLAEGYGGIKRYTKYVYKEDGVVNLIPHLLGM